MKFGLLLVQHALPDHRYIHYALLKQFIKREAMARDLRIKQDDSDQDQLLLQAMPETVREGDSRAQILLEMDAADAAYREKHEHLKSFMADLKATRLVTDLGEEHQLAEEIRNLRKSCLLNYLASLKIAKKHSKVLKSTLLREIEEAIQQRAFFKGLLDVTLHHLLEDISPSRQDDMCSTVKRCPICINDMSDPIRLSCDHEFCWGCLAAAAANEISSCPVCRKKQEISPLTIEINTILGAPSAKYNLPVHSGFDAFLSQPLGDVDLGLASMDLFEASKFMGGDPLEVFGMQPNGFPLENLAPPHAMAASEFLDEAMSVDHLAGLSSRPLKAEAEISVDAMDKRQSRRRRVNSFDRHSTHAEPITLLPASCPGDHRVSPVCSLFLTTLDEQRCRFAVKNDQKPKNRELGFVQKNGYVEYKARYSKKRGDQSGYGFFHLAFKPQTQSIFPMQRVPEDETQQHLQPVDDPVFHLNDVAPEQLDRLEVTLSLFQSFRGTFPGPVVEFAPDEKYYPMHITDWQEVSLLQFPPSGMQPTPGLRVEPHPDGCNVKYVLQSTEALKHFFSDDGVRFPCPMPSHPEHLNDVGTLRMQVQLKVCLNTVPGVDQVGRVQHGSTFNTWIKFKVVQQLTGTKKLFSNMLRTEGSDWSLPARPKLVRCAIPSPHDGNSRMLQHVIKPDVFKGASALDFLTSILDTMVDSHEDGMGSAAIVEAARRGRDTLVRLFLERDPSLVNASDEAGFTPLHAASEGGHLQVVVLLHTYGARATRANRGTTPVDVARKNGHRGIVEFLLTQDIDEPTKGCATIFRAAALGHLKCLKRHLAIGANPNRPNADGIRPLVFAVMHNQPFAALLLMHAGADALSTDKQGRTALHRAAEKGFQDTIAAICQHDPSTINALDLKHNTPLHAAAANGHALSVTVLLRCCAEAATHNLHRKSPFDLAAGHPITQLALASKSAQGSLSDFLEGRVPGSLHEAARHGDVCQVRKLLAAGANPNQLDAKGDTALKVCARDGNAAALDEMLVWLANHNQAPVCECGEDGMSPLHVAIYAKSVMSLIVLVVSKMFDINSPVASTGDAPLHIAARLGNPIAAAFLRLAGASRAAQNALGYTPNQLAGRDGHLAVLQVLNLSPEELKAASKVLHDALPPPRRQDRNRDVPSVSEDVALNPSELHKILACLWHSVDQARRSLGKTRQ